MPEISCPMCRESAEMGRSSRGYEISCKVCGGDGPYVLGPTLFSILNGAAADSADAKLARYLSAHVRQYKGSRPVVLTSDDWKGLAEGIRSTPVAMKIEKLLRLIAGQSSYPGESVKISGQFDYPLVDASNRDELHFMLEHLEATGLAALERGEFSNYLARILPKGWEKIQSSTDKGIPGRCFVAMSFGESFNEVYDMAIEPALRSCGLDPRRIDRIPDNRDINEKIIAELREAELMVADFTGQRDGVYFEAGFARGLGKEVFWCCRKDDMPNLHFDTRQFAFIDWSGLEDLKRRLTDKIKAMGFARS